MASIMQYHGLLRMNRPFFARMCALRSRAQCQLPGPIRIKLYKKVNLERFVGSKDPGRV